MPLVDSRSESAAQPQATGANMAVPSPSKAPTTNQGTQPDAQRIVGEINIKFTNWRSLKRPQEVQWFINAAMLRGLQNVRWNDALAQLETKAVPAYKMVPSINIVLPKTRQRKAKFLKQRYAPIVVPATCDKEDKLNAEASQLALEYIGRKRNLEKVYTDTLDWSLTTGKGFMWIYWDDKAMGNVKVPIELLQQLQQSGQPIPPEFQGGSMQQPIGDVYVEAGSPFEVLVPDLATKSIGQQQEIMRVRAVPLEELKRKWSDIPGINDLQGDSSATDLFQYQKQISTLSARVQNGMVSALGSKSDKELNMVIRKEWFARPCGKYPHGAYAVTAGTLLLKYQEVLPYGFELLDNPYPVVELADIELAGQFWPTCTVEQLAGIQREYNDYRSKLKNHLAKCIHPKIIASIYSKWPEGAWNDEPGEVIQILTPPGVMEPHVVQPPMISPDLWKALEMLRGEADMVANLPPASPQGPGAPQSGFQLNMLQEQVDSVHAPDIRRHEAAFEELYYKLRKIMAQGYDVPRLISISGKNHIPDEVEFSAENIDENAEIIVYTGSALSHSPAVRTQQVIELWNAGILQDSSNPVEAQRKALDMLDAQGITLYQEKAREDEEKARLENLNFTRSQPVIPPLPFDNHTIHYDSHCSQMKGSEFDQYSDVQKKEIYAHTLLHMKYVNPQQAVNTALELGIPELLPMLMPPQMPGQPPPPQQASQGQPPPGGPDGQEAPAGPPGAPAPGQ
jgi:hypothetical protein